MFHISSPIEGWKGPKPERHHDFIDVRDFPACWPGLYLTVEVEAKAKEAAVLKLIDELEQQCKRRRLAARHDRADYSVVLAMAFRMASFTPIG